MPILSVQNAEKEKEKDSRHARPASFNRPAGGQMRAIGAASKIMIAT